MLKWTVMARREAAPVSGSLRPLADNQPTATAVQDATPSRPRPRRRSSVARRRSSVAGRLSAPRRISIGCADLDKENKFTSTPIKSHDDLHQLDALKDVSNLTPKDTVNRRDRVFSTKSCNKIDQLHPADCARKTSCQRRLSGAKSDFAASWDCFRDSKLQAFLKGAKNNNKVNETNYLESAKRDNFPAFLKGRNDNISTPLGIAKNNNNPHLFSGTKNNMKFNILTPSGSAKKPKKKKLCVNPLHPNEFVSNENNLTRYYLRNAESVDSHIRGLENDSIEARCGCGEENSLLSTANNRLKRRIPDTYAPTLPTFAAEYSPCPMRTTHCLQTLNSVSSSKITPLSRIITSQLGDDSNHPPNKRPKIDHVNDFLQQISFRTSPEPMNYPTFTKECPSVSSVKVSPLVKRMVGLRFNGGSNSDEEEDKDGSEDSSYINELSLDKIVDVLLESTPAYGRGAVVDNTSTLVHVDEDEELPQRDNELNETHEENMINSEHERKELECASSFDRCSSDSGFRSSATENSHQLDVNFTCKCKSIQEYTNLQGLAAIDRTIIEINGTFRERGVDVSIVNHRKRRSSTALSPDDSSKRVSLDPEESRGEEEEVLGEPWVNTLRRQRCVRRRRTIVDNVVKDHRFGEDVRTSSEDYPMASNKATSLLNISQEVRASDSSCYSALQEVPMTDESGAAENRRLRRQSTPSQRSSGWRTRRCLLFDSPSSEDRSSFSESSCVSARSLSDVGGIMELKIFQEDDCLIVDVVRCRELYRPNGRQINAYVKAALVDKVGYARKKLTGNLQRTAVQADSVNPFFNYTFKFPFPRDDDSMRRLQIEVWHRERSTRTSEFLGCMSFTVQNGCEKEISGSFRLLPQSLGRLQNAPITTDNNNHQHQQHQQHLEDVCKNDRDPTRRRLSTTSAGAETAAMCESQQSSVEELMTVDQEAEMELQGGRRVSQGRAAALSEAQRAADEHLFLRYLELDPVEGPDAVPAATQRRATGNRNGRTPFTHTRRLQRGPRQGFGFSVVWTHPPRVERVERGLPADKAGLLPGDYIILVDKHNVVTMPELEILDLIRSYGSQLTLEVFRRNSSRNGSVPSVIRLNSVGTASTAGLPQANPQQTPRRPSTVCSTNTVSADCGGGRRRLHLPQVTFTAEKPSSSQEDNRRRVMYQLIHKEQQYSTAMQFAVTRFVSALNERRDLLTPAEHKTLFQNSEEVLRLTEDILDQLMSEDGEPQVHQVARTYYSRLGEVASVYRRYCSGIKRADWLLASKTKNSGSDFVRFLQTPAVPRRRPDITAFIHKPLDHFREVLQLLTVLQSYTKPKHEDYAVINQVVNTLQSTYREITVEAGLMEPTGEGRPLLSVQDLENRLVFTKCKPFTLTKPGRQWIFGSDLSRVEGRNVRQYWTLLFSDLLLFAKVSKDRVLFITEEPLPLVNITDMFFNIRKKDTEFRIAVVPGGRAAKSPTVHCGPDLTRTPRKGAGKRTVILRAPTPELKAVWQNLLQRQVFQVNTSMDGSAFSSPLESPDAPITSSVVTLQSAESLSFRRQTPQPATPRVLHPLVAGSGVATPTPPPLPPTLDGVYCDLADSLDRQLDALIEHKCQLLLSRTGGGRSSAFHLEKWMKGELGHEHLSDVEAEEDDEEGEAEDAAEALEPLSEDWTAEMLRKRSEELRLIDSEGNVTSRADARRAEAPTEEPPPSDAEQSPSKSTTTESQVTVRSSPLMAETVSVCRQCHKNCLPGNGRQPANHVNPLQASAAAEDERMDEEDDWRPLVLMGFSALNPATSLVKLDPFSAPPPRISIDPATPETTATTDSGAQVDACVCHNRRPEIDNIDFCKEVDASPDDSPQTEEHPYHSLSSSNLTLRRYGTVSSLERLGGEESEDQDHQEENHRRFSSSEDEDDEMRGIDNEAFTHSSTIISWTAKAGSFVAEKMSFFERLGEDYRAGGKFLERYLNANNPLNGEDGQEDETSGATSGEEIWGTPTSGGELDDPLSSPNYDGKQSPNDGSVSSENCDDTELMMDELLMTPPITGAALRGLLPRRTLEPLIEEDFSESYTSSTTTSPTPTEPSVSPEEQDRVTGGAADTCSTAAASRADVAAPEAKEEEKTAAAAEKMDAPPPPGTEGTRSASRSAAGTPEAETAPRIHRADSYRRIIEAVEEDDTVGFFNRFKPTARFCSIERVPRSKSVRIFEFFNVRRAERRIHETFPEPSGHLISFYNKEGALNDDDSSSYSQKPVSPRRLKDKQLDRRFWKQLSKRRGNRSTDSPPSCVK